MHPELIKRGFLEYVNGQPPEGRVFPKLKRVNDRYGHGLGNWFGTFRKRVGVDEDGKVFHSFRHTVATRLKEAGVEDSLVAEVLRPSHAGQTSGRYAKASGPQVLMDRGHCEAEVFDGRAIGEQKGGPGLSPGPLLLYPRGSRLLLSKLPQHFTVGTPSAHLTEAPQFLQVSLTCCSQPWVLRSRSQPFV